MGESSQTIVPLIKRIVKKIPLWDHCPDCSLVPKEVIDAAPNLQVIGRHGVGVDNIDGGGLTRDFSVIATPNANALSVAEWTLTAISIVAKGLLIMIRPPVRPMGAPEPRYVIVDLDQKTLGLVGIGRISLVATKPNCLQHEGPSL